MKPQIRLGILEVPVTCRSKNRNIMKDPIEWLLPPVRHGHILSLHKRLINKNDRSPKPMIHGDISFPHDVASARNNLKCSLQCEKIPIHTSLTQRHSFFSFSSSCNFVCKLVEFVLKPPPVIDSIIPSFNASSP